MSALDGKVAIVTGASSGIGRAAAKLFAQEGAKLVITARRQVELNTLVDDISCGGGEAISIPGDIRDETLAQELVNAATRRFGGLDIALNNAGAVGEMAPAADISPAGWRETLDINLTSAFLHARQQIPALVARGGGSLIFTSSFVGHTVGFPGMAAYAASKAGLIGMTQVIAAEYGPKRVRANALLPGGTDTPIAVWNTPGADPGLRSFIENLFVLKRVAQPEEIARAALFLASDASSFVTGSAMLADGGVSISRT